MRKLMLVAAAVALVFVAACKKDKPTNGGGTTNTDNTVFENKVKTAYIYFGGTWCGPCGAYGKPTKEALHEDAQNSDVVFMSFGVFNNDAFRTTATDLSATNMGVTGVPTAFIGGAQTLYKIGFYTDNNYNKTQQQGNIATVKALTPKVLGNLSATGASGSIDVTAKIKNLEASTDEYFVSIVLLENNLTAAQTSDGSTTKKNIHDFVVRTMNGLDLFGTSAVKAPTKDKISTLTKTFILDANWVKTNMDIAMLIWKKDSAGKYALENAQKIKMP